tara:strand:- start:1 stop:123 length:123 start_codon:yes stop_codon:yes gene_type:complete
MFFGENGVIFKKFNKVFNTSVEWETVHRHISKENSEEQRF